MARLVPWPHLQLAMIDYRCRLGPASTGTCVRSTGAHWTTVEIRCQRIRTVPPTSMPVLLNRPPSRYHAHRPRSTGGSSAILCSVYAFPRPKPAVGRRHGVAAQRLGARSRPRTGIQAQGHVRGASRAKVSKGPRRPRICASKWEPAQDCAIHRLTCPSVPLCGVYQGEQNVRRHCDSCRAGACARRRRATDSGVLRNLAGDNKKTVMVAS